MERTHTKTGLWVTVEIIEMIYSTGEKAPEGFKETMTIAFFDLLPKWNYRAIPQKQHCK